MLHFKVFNGKDLIFDGNYDELTLAGTEGKFDDMTQMVLVFIDGKATRLLSMPNLLTVLLLSTL